MGSIRSARRLFFGALALGIFGASCLESTALFSLRDDDSPSGGSENGGGAGMGAQGGASGRMELVEYNWLDCLPYKPGLHLDVCSSGYLGTSGSDEIASISALGGGWLVGVLLGDESERASLPQLRGASGRAALVLLDSTGRRQISAALVGDRLAEIRFDRSSRQVIALVDDAVVALSWDFSEVLWEQGLTSPGVRLDVGPDGRIAVLGRTNDVRVFSVAGEPLAEFSVASGKAADLALSNDGSHVHIVGWKDDPSALCQGEVPFLRTYSFEGVMLRRAYDFETVTPECASSRGLRVSRGADGKLYYAGSNWGGNTVHRKDPANLANPAPLISTDLYNQGYGKAILRYGFVARFAPTTLGMEIGTLVLPRDEAEVGGEYLVDALEADAEGKVYVAATATCCMSDRASRTVAGQLLGSYQHPESSFLVLSSNFRDRLIWTSFTLDAQTSTGTSELALGEEGFAFALTTAGPTKLIVRESQNPEPLGLGDGFLSVVRAR